MKWTHVLTLILTVFGTIACGDEGGSDSANTLEAEIIRDAGLGAYACVNHSDCQIGEVCRFGQCSMEVVEPIEAEGPNDDADKEGLPADDDAVTTNEEMVEPAAENSRPSTQPPLPDPTTPEQNDEDQDATADPACARDFDCPVGHRCNDGTCVARESADDTDNGCRADVECGPNRQCIDGVCVSADETAAAETNLSGAAADDIPCAGAGDCAAGQRCVEGVCAAPECGDGRPCADDFSCQAGTCVPAADQALDLNAEDVDAVGEGVCDAPDRIRIGDQIVGRTPAAENRHEGGCGTASGPETVFKFVALANETVCITTSETNYDPIVYVRTGDCDTGMEAACNDDDRDFDIAPGVFDAAVQFNTTVGTSYYIFVDGSREQAGDFQLNLSSGPCVAGANINPEPPENPLGADDVDDVDAAVNEICENAPDLSANVAARGDTRDGLANHRAACGTGFGKEEVYHYRSFIDRTVCVMTEGAEFFTTLYVQADVCGGEERMVETLACAEHPAASRDAQLEFQATGLTHYYIFVDSIQDGGNYSIKLIEGPCPEEP
ncbi:MAG: hypothetical protein VX589_15635 [Myxococcota bacterium]|nr:hypothetical protein [Myxococcota bacterium]